MRAGGPDSVGLTTPLGELQTLTPSEERLPALAHCTGLPLGLVGSGSTSFQEARSPYLFGRPG